MKLLKNQNSGFILPSIIVISLFLTILSLVVSELAVNNLKLSFADQQRLSAQLAADAGADFGVVSLNLDNSWTSTGGEVELYSRNDVRATYEVNYQEDPLDNTLGTLTATGRVYKPASDTTPRDERTYVLDLRNIGGSAGDFSLVTGVGGLYMDNSAKVVDGAVFVNGELNMANTAQIGTATKPVKVEVAHHNCPAGGGASYPVTCTSGQPISMANSSHIYGQVCAKNQTNDHGRMTDSGLDVACSGSSSAAPDAQPLPAHDRAAQKAAVTNTINGDYICNSNSAQWTLPANTRITGKMEIQKKCKITILGDVWVQGEFIIKNTAQIIVSNSLGTTRPNFMVDGPKAEFENSAQLVGNNQGTGMQFITYWSKASCSPDCADVTGQDLYDSRSEVTLLLKNSAQAPQSILYARWTQAQLDNGGDIGAIIGQTVKLQNSAAVTFGASVGAGTDTEKTFLINGYRRQF